ncbi:c-type cytochrome domain-containing protein [Fulvivirgaceae bacterium BMA10]|uniref:C-type cytochrome domain-containing protein n=1 Tax=Splendidivirga corallicola TaxID=3051826 RepID=A0ABT8KSE7_9BACT|nr:c-type cytochrome domain-containing protein [Fulvivirgaceae bacterium BMA10]
MNVELFLGRFHPLVVHLPIGFLLLAVIMEFLSRFSKSKFKNLDLAISISILLGGIGAIGAAIIGYLLAGSGGYDDQTLFWHKWLGIGLSALAFLAWAMKIGYVKLPKSYASIMMVILVVLVSVTGHLGGNLTHGKDYLLHYAPEFIQNMAGMRGKDIGNQEIPQHVDSIVVFEHLIQPVLHKKCGNCHNETKANGGLIMTTIEGLNEGGDNGEVIVGGKSYESELFLRTTLPQGNRKFMPPKGEPMTYSELRILEWWLDNGAHAKGKLSDLEIPDKIQTILLSDYQIDTKPKPYFDIVQVSPVSENEMNELIQAGFSVSPLSDGHHLLQVRFDGEEIKSKQIEALLLAKEQITWLELANKSLSDEMLMVVGKLTNLTRLKLSNNPITNAGITYLEELEHLEVLNLYSTEVTNESVKSFKRLPTLKRLYLWKTNITNEGLESLKKELPGVNIVDGTKIKP